ncbi:class I SAM-dependent methyltransferase [Streptomyces sp. NPDC088789]|uniref:class I SAM-dependent methyltransferase n=1 Tax=Streptomyces sp. NPDC088789 TaxID=3365899 RepID=UPI0037F66AB8
MTDTETTTGNRSGNEDGNENGNGDTGGNGNTGREEGGGREDGGADGEGGKRAAEAEARTRVFYDAIAEEYAQMACNWLEDRPLERALLDLYAELVGPEGEVADLGCGPGRVTGYLAARGLSAHGLDLSESMLTVARRENPGLRFERGSMLETGAADGSLAGVVSMYSSIHTPVELLPALFAEFHRVLRPGGQLLLAFQVGDAPRTLTEPFGHPVTLDFLRRRPERMAALLEEAGFAMFSRTVREADEASGELTPHAFLFARKPQ